MRKFRLEEVLARVIRHELAKVKVSLPAKIVEYDHSEQKATVQPLIKPQFFNPETEEIQAYELKELVNLPVLFPSSKDHSLSWPLERGDRVTVIFSDRNLDDWLLTDGEDIESEDPRRFSWTDAVVVPGGRAFVSALTGEQIEDDAIVLFSDKEVVIRGKKKILSQTEKYRVEASDSTVVECSDIKLGGDAAFKPIALSPDVAQWLIQFVTTWAIPHTHVDPLSGTTGPPITPATPPALTEFDSSSTKAT